MILIVSALFPPEPLVSASLSLDVATELCKNNDVVVITPPSSRPHGSVFSENNKYCDSAGISHVIVNSFICSSSNVFGRMRESYSFGMYVRKYIKKHNKRIDVIYANTWPLFSQKIIADISKKYKIPLVLHIQDIYPESLSIKIPYVGRLINILFLPLDINVLKKTSTIVTISNKMKDYLVNTRSINSKDIVVVRNWQEDAIFIKSNDVSRDKNNFVFMYLGNIGPTANVELLIDAYILSNIENSSLVIAGSGSNKQKCIDLVKKNNYKNIVFKNVSQLDVPKAQSEADVLLLALKQGVGMTALPSKLTAYMLSGKPIIASVDYGSEVADIIIAHQCGKVAIPDDVTDLKNKMIELSSVDKLVLTEMGLNSFSFAKNNLSKRMNLSKLCTVISSYVKEIE